MLEIERQVEFYIDIHGHSRKFNAFLYGNCFVDANDDPRNNALIKVLPLLLDQKSDYYSFKDCTFALEKEKESTSRQVMFREL